MSTIFRRRILLWRTESTMERSKKTFRSLRRILLIIKAMAAIMQMGMKVTMIFQIPTVGRIQY